MSSALRDLRAAQKTGSPNRFAGFGNTATEYLDQIEATAAAAAKLQEELSKALVETVQHGWKLDRAGTGLFAPQFSGARSALHQAYRAADSLRTLRAKAAASTGKASVKTKRSYLDSLVQVEVETVPAQKP